MDQSAIKKEWDYKHLILSSMWPAAPRQKGGGISDFPSPKFREKHQNY